MASDDDKDKGKDSGKDGDDKKAALKGLFKEVLQEVIAEERDSGRTDSGKEKAEKRGSVWDNIFGA